MNVIVTFSLCVIYLSGTQVLGMSDLGYHSGRSRIRCDPVRTENVSPVITDLDGREASTIFSQSSKSDTLLLTVPWRHQYLQIELHRNPVAAPASISESDEDGTTSIKFIDTSCTYQGHVRGQRSSYVALSTCEGLSGYIQTDEEILFIMPGNHEGEGEGAPNAHIVYTCEPKKETLDTSEEETTAHARHRRSTGPTKYVEVQVVADHTIERTAGSRSKATDYIMTLMNIANTVYQHNSLGQNIRLAVVKIVFLNQNQQREVFRLKNPGETVKIFNQWLVKNRNGQNYDVSLLLTEDNFGHAGFAPVGVMCRQDKNGFAVRDEGFTTGFIIAHEMGHVFGLSHDGDKNSCGGSSFKNTIMSAIVTSTFNHYWWSHCSKTSLAEEMRTLQCLDDRPTAVDNHYRLTADQTIEEDLGMAFSLDYQCAKDFGKDYVFCTAMRSDPCQELVCSPKSAPLSCYTRKASPLPGTNCGENKKCYNNKCVERGTGSGTDEEAVDGSWGDWAAWTGCSNGCGVGVKRRARTCQFPANVRRGKECDGEANEVKTCADYTCTQLKDPRAEQCATWDTTKEISKWLPYQTRNASLMCLQNCRALPSGVIYVNQENVVDGTPCSYIQETSNICLNGKCTKVGCDGELNSDKRLDACGNCGGDGSDCKRLVAEYKKASPSVRRYLKVVRIPAGARHVQVMKNSDSYSFLAAKDGSTRRYLLNGDRKYVQSIQIIHKGAFIYYNHGNSSFVEIIATPGPLATPLEVMIYLGGRVNEITVSYNFTISKDDDTFEKGKFQWKFEEWSSCSVTCGRGIKETVYGCYDKDSRGKVDAELCAVLTPHRVDKSQCTNKKCPSFSHQWKATNDWTDCDADCDETGSQSRIYQCQKMDGNVFVANADASECDDVQKAVETRQCEGPPCVLRWTTGEWSECSKTCGRGWRRREVYCGDSESDNDDSKCTDEAPLASKRCNNPSCPGRKGKKCKDKLSFCSRFGNLANRCKDRAFNKVCCITCRNVG